MTLAGLNLTINTDNTGTLTVDGAGGNDTVTVHGTSGADTIDVVRGATTTVTVNGMKTIRLPQTSEALTVAAGAGADTINVMGTQAGGVALTVLGGGPTSLPPLAHDRMNVTNVASGTTVYTPGDSVDSGMLSTPDGTIAFQGLEYVNVIGTGADTYAAHGTNGPDEITLQNNGANRIWINNQSVLEFSEFATVNLLGRFGSDTFSVHPAGLVGVDTVNVIGGDPTASDSLTVNGSAAADDITYTPTAFDAGRVQMAGSPIVDFTGTERLTVNGLGGGDSLTIIGTAGDDTIVHTPHAGIDEGHVRVNTLLGIEYRTLGVGAGANLTIDGSTGDDTLVVDGTGQTDTFTVAATTGSVTLANSHGTRLTVQQANVQNLVLDGREGDDTFTINSPQPYASVTVNGGGPGASDILVVNGAAGVDEAFTVNPGNSNGNGDVQVDALVIPYTGIELILLDANAGDTDTLTVNDDLADNWWTVKAGPIFGDRIQIDSREAIDYLDFNGVTLVNEFGADQFVIHPTHLVGTDAITVVSNAPGVRDDVVTIMGTEGDDEITSTIDAITVNGGVPVTVGGAGAGFAEVRIFGLGGNDIVGHDGLGGNPAPLSLGLPGVRKFVDGGAGDDIINMSLTQDAVIFGGDGDDWIVGTPLADFIDGGRGDDTIFGLAGDDVIYGGEGNDTIIGGPGFDQLFGGDGSDTIIWNPGDGSDLVEGGSDEADRLVFNGSDAAEVFHIFADLADPSRAILFRSVGNLTIDMAGSRRSN
jgi:large repetitive protein